MSYIHTHAEMKGKQIKGKHSGKKFRTYIKQITWIHGKNNYKKYGTQSK